MVMYLARSITIKWRARKPGLRLTDWGSGTTAAGIKTGELVFVQKRAKQGTLEPHTVARTVIQFCSAEDIERRKSDGVAAVYDSSWTRIGLGAQFQRYGETGDGNNCYLYLRR
jgi:hypothetical protein